MHHDLAHEEKQNAALRALAKHVASLLSYEHIKAGADPVGEVEAILGADEAPDGPASEPEVLVTDAMGDAPTDPAPAA